MRTDMKRLIYRAQMKAGMEEKAKDLLREEKRAKELVENGMVMTFAAFSWKKNIFLYYECMDEEVFPEEVFPGVAEYLEDWPGKDMPRKWIPMIDVFHFNEPVSKEHWLRVKKGQSGSFKTGDDEQLYLLSLWSSGRESFSWREVRYYSNA